MTFRNSRFESKLARRHFLRGAGGVAVGLPFLLGREGSLSAQGAAATPERLITVYYGNGFPPALAQNGYTGVLASLAPFQNKLTMLRGINTHAEAQGPGHDAGSHAYCCGFGSLQTNENKQGPSLDWVAKEALKPTTPFETVSAGVYSGKQGGKRVRWIHSWRGKDQPNEPFSNPQKLFSALFAGQNNGQPPDATETEAMKQLHLQRKSVLDAVGKEYEAVKAAGYPASSIALIDDHLTILRGVEKRVNDLAERGMSEACVVPTGAMDLDATEGKLDGYMQHWERLWPLVADIYVAGLRCDLFRFGNVLVTNGGDEFSHKVGNEFAEDIHGDWFHEYDNGRQIEGTEAIIKWEWDLISYFLKQMDDPAFLDANGKTLLDNTTTFLGTELALQHDHENLTFFMAGSHGRFKPGVQDLGARSDVDMYQTILKSLNVDTKFGDQTYATGLLPILA